MVALGLFFAGCHGAGSVVEWRAGVPVRVELPVRTVLDDPGVCITTFTDRPAEEIVLPADIPLGPRWFIDVFYTRQRIEDFNITGLVVPRDDADILFLDLDNDEDLGNDGEPFVFRKDEESLRFAIVAGDDPRQVTPYILHRTPPARSPEDAEWFRKHLFDADGNLQPEHARTVGGRGRQVATAAGLFYFDERVCLRRGEVKTVEGPIALGVFDNSNNGLFDDDDDGVIVDRNGDGKLQWLMSNEGFGLHEPFPLGEQWVRVDEVDPYGEWLTLIPTDQPAGRRLPSEGIEVEVGGDDGEGMVDPGFWEREFADVDGRPVRLGEYKGSHLLMSFWGEWCGPCVAELPILKAARDRYGPQGLRIIGFLETRDLGRARTLVREVGADWPQVRLDEALARELKIRAYPTNILVATGGERFVRTASVDAGFFERHVAGVE